MKAASAGGGTVRIDEVDIPAVGSGDVLVRMEMCGICGSDVEKVYGQYSKPSMRLGHEPAGTVVEVGSEVQNLRAGDRVFTHHHVPCNTCILCMRNLHTLCKKYSASNLDPCGLAEEYLVPEYNVPGILHLPDSVSFGAAAMIEPLACCVRAWEKMGDNVPRSVAVFGAGPTGILHAMLARHYGTEKIICIDPNRFRLDFAEKLGIAEGILPGDAGTKIPDAAGGGGADCTIVATSSMDALRQAVAYTAKGGTIVMFGVPSRGARASLDMDAFYSGELRMLASYAASERDTAKALDLIASGRIRAEQLVTHRFALEESGEAFEIARTGNDAMKILVGRA